MAEADAPGPSLRVAVVVASLTVPAWVASTVARIEAEDGFELAAVVLAAPSAGAARPRAYRVYEWADARVFGPAGALRQTDLAAVAGGGPMDVVVSFVPPGRPAWSGPPPRHGVWVVVPMDDGQPGSATARFWDVHRRRKRGSTALVVVQDGRPRVLARSSAHVDRLSVTRTRDAAAWASARLVLDGLRAIRGGPVAPAEPLTEPPGPPLAATTVGHAAVTVGRGLRATALKAWRRGEWFVAVRPLGSDGRGHGPVQILPNPPGRYLADPFPIEHDGRHYLFCEDYSQASRRAAISVCELGPGGVASAPRRVLERDHHLSYPLVFKHEGVVYMLPETAEAGRVELHRAVEFPYRWQLHRVLLNGLTAVDGTLHIEKGLVWLFANVVAGPGDPGELRLYWSRSLDEEFRPHPGSPIVSDPGSARPAGRLYRREGALYRPGQDCSRRYGEAIVVNRVDVLTTTEYRETPVGRIEPDWMPGIEATHTYTFDSKYECLDGYRHVRRLRPRARRTGSA